MSIASHIGTKLAGGAVIAFLLLASASVASAQTNTTGTMGTGTSATTTTPGVPNTGAGGALGGTLALLATTGALALGSGMYLSRQKKFSAR